VASAHARERRRRLTYRAFPLGVIALAALGLGLSAGSAFESGSERTARAFGRAWETSDYPAMHRLLSPAAAARYPVRALRSAYERANTTATAAWIEAGEPERGDGDRTLLPVRVETRVFGTIRGELRLRVDAGKVDWRPRLVFPGLADGDRLRRDSVVPERAGILSAHGQVLATGPANARTSPEGGVGSSIAGAVEPSADPIEREQIYARGFPKDTPIGVSGLERALQSRLQGRPGGVLRAGERVLARASAKPAAAAQSTIDTAIQRAADTALAERFGGIAALDPRTAEIRALSGVAFSAPQPPGSTFKIVTAAAALEDRLVKLSDEFPVISETTIDGVPLENSNGELCGGTFIEAFAHSCNSVFAPLGIKVGSRRLVAMAERFGFNESAPVPGSAPSTLPSAGEIVSPLEVGSSAIGQGKVLATPLQIASVAQTIASDGVRLPPTLVPTPRSRGANRVVRPATARKIERMMVAVVRYGTGTAASLPSVKVAGKTGTAELEDTRGPSDADEEAKLADPSNTDAWFTAYAPVKNPRIAVAVMLIRNGAGGETAAPAAREVLAAALNR